MHVAIEVAEKCGKLSLKSKSKANVTIPPNCKINLAINYFFCSAYPLSWQAFVNRGRQEVMLQWNSSDLFWLWSWIPPQRRSKLVLAHLVLRSVGNPASGLNKTWGWDDAFDSGTASNEAVAETKLSWSLVRSPGLSSFVNPKLRLARLYISLDQLFRMYIIYTQYRWIQMVDRCF